MRRFSSVLLYLVLLNVSCATPSTPLPQEVNTLQPTITPQTSNFSPPTITSTSTPQPDEIRFALIGAPHDLNVWELFGGQGAGYADFAPRVEYYPRLYHLAPPDFSFQPFAAQGLPSAMIPANMVFSSTVNLRTDLKWSDGSPFVAEDVAFTVNTALAFDLGFDWGTSYPRDYLDHAEMVNPYAVKFVFKKQPHVGVWQYGALQGVIVQKKFWQPRTAKAEELLPTPAMSEDIEKARARLTLVQSDVDRLTAQLRAVRETGAEGRGVEIELTQRKLELGYAKNTLNKALSSYQSALETAQQALYALDNKNEPTLGSWVFESKTNSTLVNKVNSAFPFGKPNFARASYHFYENEDDALAAFKKDELDFILSPNGLSRAVNGARNTATYGARFLVFNPTLSQFADPAFRAALNCMIDRKDLAQNILQNQAAPLNGFIVSPQWINPETSPPCAGMDRSSRVEYAVKLLKDAGYSWSQQPTSKNSGKRLTSPKGAIFPNIALSAPSKQADALRYAAAKYIAKQAQYLGIPFSVKEMSLDDLIYVTYSSQKYDVALVGWRLSEYPGYICEWFGGRNPYLYNSRKFASRCNALGRELDLVAARESLHQLESELMIDASFIPLFTTTRMDIYQNLAYPAPIIANGWSGLYGAPSYAMPMP